MVGMNMQEFEVVLKVALIIVVVTMAVVSDKNPSYSFCGSKKMLEMNEGNKKYKNNDSMSDDVADV